MDHNLGCKYKEWINKIPTDPFGPLPDQSAAPLDSFHHLSQTAEKVRWQRRDTKMAIVISYWQRGLCSTSNRPSQHVHCYNSHSHWRGTLSLFIFSLSSLIKIGPIRSCDVFISLSPYSKTIFIFPFPSSKLYFTGNYELKQNNYVEMSGFVCGAQRLINDMNIHLSEKGKLTVIIW